MKIKLLVVSNMTSVHPKLGEVKFAYDIGYDCNIDFAESKGQPACLLNNEQFFTFNDAASRCADMEDCRTIMRLSNSGDSNGYYLRRKQDILVQNKNAKSLTRSSSFSQGQEPPRYPQYR